MRIACIEADLPYHGGLLGAHMHDSRATRPGEVDTMIGEWLGVLPSTPARQIHLSGGTDAEVDFVPGSEGHGL
jgi:L-ascorbate metabolism protein UlaG (beta-lactamase superfamily)